MNDISLANFVIEAGQNTRGPTRDAIRAVGRELMLHRKYTPDIVKRYVHNDDVRQRWRALRDFPIEEFTAQFDRIRIPFNKLWIEDEPDPDTLGTFGTLQRKGFLMTKHEAEIRARYVMEFTLPALDSPLQRQAVNLMKNLNHIRNGHYIIADDVEVVMSKNGISIDAQKSIHTKLVSRGLSVQGQTPYSGGSNEQKIAEDIYRLLVLVCSRNVTSNLYTPAEPRHISEHPTGDLTPITIDLSAPLRRSLETGDVKVTRDLLGWTDVARHTRTYHTRNGPVVREIEPYERRIAAPVDRREVTRNLKLNDPNATLALPPRPTDNKSARNDNDLTC